MKNYCAIAFLFLTISLFAQEKGVIPISTGIGQLATGQTYAVVVGISDYQDEGITDLRFADKDALAFAGFLQSPAGGSLDEDHLKVLINKQATHAQFARALDWLWEVAGENDRAIIYFSGHGDVEKKSITQPGYLLCWDAPSHVYMAGGAFNVRDLKDVVSTISLQNKAKVVLITDACRSGKLSGSGIGGAQATATNLSQQFANEVKILSCQPDEYSIEGEQWGGGRGAFSYHLLDGLYGMADRDNDQTVTVREIDMYLGDHVTPEVAPQNQLPMVVGNGREKLTDIFPEILAQIKEGRKGQMQIFAATESRGIEDDVLAAADSNVVVQYFAFKRSLEEKAFLFPENASAPADKSADFYYELLIKEPQLERLHSSMRRNYAAALQDDAQQALIGLMNMEPEEQKQSKKTLLDKYRPYPANLERAAEILSNHHYMYKTLKARRYLFEALMLKLEVGENANSELGNHVIDKCRQSLTWQNSNAYIFYLMANAFGHNLNQRDSMMFYMEQAVEEVPTWQQPYITTSWILYPKYGDFKAAISLLGRASVIDTNAYLLNGYGVVYANRYLNDRQTTDLEIATTYFLKSNALDKNFIYPYNNLGALFNNSGRPNEGEKILKKGIAIDSTHALLWANLAISYKDLDQIPKAINTLLKIISLDSTLINTYVDLGTNYLLIGDLENAGEAFKKAHQLDSTSLYYKEKIEFYFWQIKDFKKSEKILKELISASVNVPLNLYNLACNMAQQMDAEQAFIYLERALESGWTDYDWMQKDTDLSLLREQPERWEALMRKYFPEEFKE